MEIQKTSNPINLRLINELAHEALRERKITAQKKQEIIKLADYPTSEVKRLLAGDFNGWRYDVLFKLAPSFLEDIRLNNPALFKFKQLENKYHLKLKASGNTDYLEKKERVMHCINAAEMDGILTKEEVGKFTLIAKKDAEAVEQAILSRIEGKDFEWLYENACKLLKFIETYHPKWYEKLEGQYIEKIRKELI